MCAEIWQENCNFWKSTGQLDHHTHPTSQEFTHFVWWRINKEGLDLQHSMKHCQAPRGHLRIGTSWKQFLEFPSNAMICLLYPSFFLAGVLPKLMVSELSSELWCLLSQSDWQTPFLGLCSDLSLGWPPRLSISPKACVLHIATEPIAGTKPSHPLHKITRVPLGNHI